MSSLDFKLLNWQQEVLKDKSRFKIVCAGRRCGKSRLAAILLLINGLRCPQGSAVMYVAPTQGQARVIIWDVLMELGREVIKSSHVNNMEITLVNDIKIYVRGADRPDTLRGVSLTYVVLDEYADMKQQVWEQIIRASLSDKKGDALFVFTCSLEREYRNLTVAACPELSFNLPCLEFLLSSLMPEAIRTPNVFNDLPAGADHSTKHGMRLPP